MIELQTDGKVSTLTINRPDVLNALSADVLLGLREKILSLSDTRVLVLRGAGEKAFVAGADIKAMQKMSTLEARAFTELGQGVIQLIEEGPWVSIAAVHGFALGGGLELALACDLIYASEKAKFGAPETNLGIIPGFGGTVNLIDRVGFSAAMDWILTGRILDAKEALDRHLISQMFSSASFFEEVQKLAGQLSKKGLYSMLAAKRLVRQMRASDKQRALLLERESFATLFASGEPQEGMSAFLEKRTPNFNTSQ